MQTRNRVVGALLALGLACGLGVRASRAQDLPRALHVTYGCLIETSERTGRRQDPNPAEEVSGGRSLHVEFDLSDLNVTPAGTRARLAVSACTATRNLGRGTNAKKEPVEMHLAGVTARVFWGADGAFRVEGVVEGAPPPEELKLIEEWNAEAIFGRSRLAGRTLAAGEEWRPDAQPLLDEVTRPCPPLPGVEDWQEADGPPTATLGAKVERVEDGLAHVRWEGRAECERAVTARVGAAPVSGNARRVVQVDEAWVVDPKLRLPIFQRNVRDTYVTRCAGNLWRGQDTTRIDVWMVTP